MGRILWVWGASREERKLFSISQAPLRASIFFPYSFARINKRRLRKSLEQATILQGAHVVLNLVTWIGKEKSFGFYLKFVFVVCVFVWQVTKLLRHLNTVIDALAKVKEEIQPQLKDSHKRSWRWLHWVKLNKLKNLCHEIHDRHSDSWDYHQIEQNIFKKA